MSKKTCKNGCNSVCAIREGKEQDVCPICWQKSQINRKGKTIKERKYEAQKNSKTLGEFI